MTGGAGCLSLQESPRAPAMRLVGPQSLRHEYDRYVERETELYKESVSPRVLYAIADEAKRALEDGAQLGMSEMLLAAEVDRLIAKRLRLPSYATWRRRRLKNAHELQRPEHWGLRPDTPLTQAIPAKQSLAPVLVAGARAEASALYLAANGCAVTALETERDVVDRVLQAAEDAGLTDRVQGMVADFLTWTPNGPLAAVVCTPAAFAGLSVEERRRVIDLLQRATTDGGVHLVETLVAGQSVMDEEELRARYAGWEISIVPEPGVSKSFVARKGLLGSGS